MMNKKTTKRALLLSALSLLLCVSMLVGSTFAWFTDSVTSGVNKIEAGNLDIELYHGKVADPASEVESATNIFTDVDGNDILWEPGVVAWTNLKVANEGSLALKYQLAINFTNENYIVENNAKLSEVLKVAFLDEAVTETTREKVFDAAKDKGVLLSDLMKSGDLAKGANKIYGVVIYWEPSANDNNWNAYNGRTLSEGEALHIDLGITLVATQKEAEFDSFGDDYDAGLENSQNGVDRTLNDGSTVRYYSEESGFGGRVRLIALPENVGTEYVVPAEVNDLGGALAGVTLDKLTISAGVEYAKKSLQGATIGEVVLTEGMTTIPDRLFYQTNIESVVIPDSVTTIEQYAFSQATVVNLVIPASVETLEEGCFAYMPNLETVVFEGDATLPKYAFRACPKLAKVEIKGDITVATTSMVFSNYESGGKDDMSFYVNSQENAEKLIACLGAYNDTNTGKDRNKWTVYINEQRFVNVKNVTELQNALNNVTQDTIINITADITGDVSFTQNNNVSLVLNGNGMKMDGGIKITARASIGNAATLDIKNFNFVTTDATREYFIYSVENNRYPNNLTISNCTFEGTGAGSKNVAVSIKTANNFVMKDCKANNVHSLLQNNNGGWGYTIQRCEVTNAGRGMSFGSAQDILVEDVKIEASNDKYGIRMAAEYDTTTTIKDCQISAFCPVVVRRASANYNLVIEGENTMTAANTDGLWCAIGTSEYETNGSMPTAATGSVTVTLNDTGLSAAGVYGAA